MSLKIAIVGAGISGLGCAHVLAREHAVTLYEAEPRLGGHTNTVDVTLDGLTHPVDTGFLVYNERTYPNLIRLFAELGVPTAKSDMSFSVSVPMGAGGSGRRLEWAGASLDTVFAQRRNLLSPPFLSMLGDLLRFNRQATAVAQGRMTCGDLTLGQFLDRNRYGTPFRRWYLLPMAGAIWSCPLETMLAYPAATFIRFCHNHGLLQVNNRPQWFTVAGGARQYVQRIAAGLADVRVGEPVLEVTRQAAGSKVAVRSRSGVESYDHVVLASHSDQSRRLLSDADANELGVIGSVGYQRNRAILHTDARLMPQSLECWSAWNYLSSGGAEPDVAVTYLLNKLQPLPFSTPVFVSLNPLIEPRADQVIAEFDYAHPVFDSAAIRAQKRLPEVQGRRHVWFAGAWTGYGFHEDGLKSGLAVAEAIGALGRQSSRMAA
jgi:predicted NAD/FAD-binding protein